MTVACEILRNKYSLSLRSEDGIAAISCCYMSWLVNEYESEVKEIFFPFYFTLYFRHVSHHGTSPLNVI